MFFLQSSVTDLRLSAKLLLKLAAVPGDLCSYKLIVEKLVCAFRSRHRQHCSSKLCMQRESDPLSTPISTLTTTSLTLLSLQTFLSPLFKSRLAKCATTQIKRWLSATTFRFLGGSSLSVQEVKRCTCTLSSLQKTKRANPLLFFLLKQAGTSNPLLTSKSTSIRKVPPWAMRLGLEDNAQMSPLPRARRELIPRANSSR